MEDVFEDVSTGLSLGITLGVLSGDVFLGDVLEDIFGYVSSGCFRGGVLLRPARNRMPVSDVSSASRCPKDGPKKYTPFVSAHKMPMPTHGQAASTRLPIPVRTKPASSIVKPGFRATFGRPPQK